MEYISKFKASKIDSLLTYVENTVKSQLADIDTIRSGASKGATAIQDVKTINGQSIVGKGNIVVEGGGGGVSSSEYFKTYPTMADYEADKANIEIPCVVMIQDTEEIVWHSPKGNYNAYYEVNQHYYDSMEQVLGASTDVVFPMLGIDGIPLTLASFMFSSFIVNGEEKITGDEYLDIEAGEENMFKTCSICVPFELDKTYEVSYTLKSQEELAEYGDILTEACSFVFAYSPLTKIIIDESWRNDYLEQVREASFAFFAYAKRFAPFLKEVTMNLEEYPFAEGEAEYGVIYGTEASIYLFRQDLSGTDTSPFSMAFADGDRVVKIPNGEGWGYAYEEGMSEEEMMQGGFIIGLTMPIESDEYLPPFNVERFDYGTI